MFNRRYRGGLTMTSHYTWAHSRQYTPVPWDFSQLEWGDTQQFDVRHRFVATASYELPFGKSLTGVAHGFLSAWQVNATAYLQSGVAYTIVNAASRTNTGNNAGTLNGGDRPMVNGDPNLPASERTVQRWFDTSVFSAAPQFTAGNIGLSLMHGPPQRRLDMSIFKDLSLGGTPQAAASGRGLQRHEHTELLAARFQLREHRLWQYLQHRKLNPATDAIWCEVPVLRTTRGHVSLRRTENSLQEDSPCVVVSARYEGFLASREEGLWTGSRG